VQASKQDLCGRRPRGQRGKAAAVAMKRPSKASNNAMRRVRRG